MASSSRQNLGPRHSLDGINLVHFRELIENRLRELRNRVRRAEVSARRRRFSPVFAAFAVGVVAVFFVLNLVGTGLPAGKRILGVATDGLAGLEERNITSSAADLESVVAEIERSQSDLEAIIQTLPLGINAREFSEASQNLLESVRLARSGLEIFLETRLTWDLESNASGPELYQGISRSRAVFVQSHERLSAAHATLASVRGELFPADARNSFNSFLSTLERAKNGTGGLLDFQTFLLNLLGGEKKTYLLLFQNNNEVRPTGGFLGTYGILEFENGTLRINRIETVYNLDGQLKEKIAAPGPLQRQVTTHWGMRDSNWFVDFPTASLKILDFLEKESGIVADGIFIFTPDLFERLLAVTGEVGMSEYGVTLNAGNFRDTVQYFTSIAYDRVLNQPKQFLADFAPQLLNRLQSLAPQDWLRVSTVLREGIQQKHLMMFSLDPALQEQISSYGATGGIERTEGDYLAIYNSNVGGGKTDIDIRTEVRKDVTVLSDRTAIIHLDITRTHEGYEEQFFPKNINFMRIFVPLSATLLSAEGFDEHELLPSVAADASTDPDLAAWDATIALDEKTGMFVGQEAGYTFFANWQELMPGEQKTARLTYEITLPRPGFYSLLFQKQPGAPGLDFDLSINYLPGEVGYTVPDEFVREAGRLSLSEKVDRDRFYGVVGK